MKRSVAASIVTLSLIAGVGAAFAADALNDGRKEPTAADQTSTTSATATPTGSPNPTRSAPVLAGPVKPGSVFPIEAGMAIRDAVATGYIEPDTGLDAACVGAEDRYRWAKPNRKGLDVLTLDGKILSIGVRSATYRTASGIGVGSSLDEVRAVYRTGLIQITSDYGQPGLLVRDGDNWLGLLFGEANPTTLADMSKVTFMEVSHGDSPALLRDGC